MSLSSWHQRLQKKLTRSRQFLPNNSGLLVAVSGGQDSMALIKLLIDLQKVHQWKLYVWHGDHKWHDQSSQIADELRIWFSDKNLEFFVSESSKGEIKTENSARNWRYEKLVAKASLISNQNRDIACLKILTAHTATDKAETLLLNLARGSDLKGLGSLKEERHLEQKFDLVRPMLLFNREETKQICEDFNIPVWIDPTNSNLDLKRNKIRHEVLPILENLHKGCTKRISDLSERISIYDKDIRTLAKMVLESISDKKGLKREKFNNLNYSLKLLLAANWLNKHQIKNYTTDSLNEMIHDISKPTKNGERNLKNDFFVEWTKEYINIKKRI